MPVYRPDIDGLRAIAVLAVVAFHLGFTGLAGGFVGVDVFFVISGYLISGNITARTERGAFSYRAFYLARARRLLPALLATVGATFIAAMPILLPDDFIAFSRSAIATVLSASNFVFYFEAGYWDRASELKPLLHTWSLGVEEQFYLIWPALLVVATRLVGVRGRLVVLLVAFAASLAGSALYTPRDPAGAFFLLPFRIFEFALGALLLPLERSILWRRLTKLPGFRDGLTLMGLGALAVAVLVFDGDTPFPALNALLPCTAAAVLILAGSGDAGPGPVARAVMENPVAVWIGRIPYSLYLVHWPVVALYRYRTGLTLDPVEQGLLALAILAAAAALHYGVERVFWVSRARRQREEPVRSVSPARFALSSAATAGVVLVLATHASLSSGWTWRFPNLRYTPEGILAGMNHRLADTAAGCQMRTYATNPACRPDAPVQILVIGNSHEADGFNFLTAGYGTNAGINLIAFGNTNFCLDLHMENGLAVSKDAECNRRLGILNDPAFIQSLDVIVFATAGPFGPLNVRYIEVLERMKALNPRIKVITFYDFMLLNTPCARIINLYGSSEACTLPEYVQAFDQAYAIDAVRKRTTALTDFFIDWIDILCRERRPETCLTETPEGIPLFYDSNHKSLEYAEMAGRIYAPQNPTLFGLVPGPIAQHDFPASALTASERVTLRQEADGAHIAGGVRDRGLNSGGYTDGARLHILPETEKLLSGRCVTVTVEGTADAELDVLVSYSTADAGNSGWHEFRVKPGDFSVSFAYGVPAMKHPGGDFVGVFPVEGEIVVRSLRVTVY